MPAVAAADTGTTTVVFNSRCPHRVGFNPQDDGKRRMGIGSSVGRAPDGSLVLWS